MFLNTCTFWDCLSKSRGLFAFNVFNVFNGFNVFNVFNGFNVFKYLKTLKTIKSKGSFSGNCF